MMYPNDNYLKYFPEEMLLEELPVSTRSGCIKVGAWIIIRKVIQYYKLEERLSEIIGEDNTGLFLDLAAYSIITENNAAQYYPDYADNHPLFNKDMRVYSDSKI